MVLMPIVSALNGRLLTADTMQAHNTFARRTPSHRNRFMVRCL